MRSPVLAFSIIAATVSPSLIGAAPTGPAPSSLDPVKNTLDTVTHTGPVAHPPRQLPSPPGLPSGSDPLGIIETVTSGGSSSDPHQPGGHSTTTNKSKAPPVPAKRADDAGTAGGNAHTGNAASASGGSVENVSEDDTMTQTNTMSNFGGLGAISQSGDSTGGSGDGFGPGGNAYTGDSSSARGGNIVNESAGGFTNTGPGNTIGAGGFSGSGAATGGNAAERRALDSQTAGGNAHSGNSGSTTSGSVANEAEGDTAVTNMGNVNQAPTLGVVDGAPTSESFTGTADGGDGGNFGPGGNAYSGSAGPSNGGYVFNSGGDITNMSSNSAANGGVSDSGAATGGDVSSADGLGSEPAFPPRKRALDGSTAGGNAYSGATGNTNGGDITNEAGDADVINNTGGNLAGSAGGSTTGNAAGGDGEGIGPGGNAYSGYSGQSRGGNVYNSAGTVTNMGTANTGGDGFDSMTGSATGGDADGAAGVAAFPPRR